MILEAAARHRIDLAASYLVGDRWRDVHAGRSAGCRTIFGRLLLPAGTSPTSRTSWSIRYGKRRILFCGVPLK
jgi:histidinol phosphatase-like enzyme